MANDITGNPWILDTAAATVVRSGEYVVEMIVWKEPTTLGHTCKITDGDGVVVFDGNAKNVGTGVQSALPMPRRPIKNFILLTLDSGTIYVYLAKG